jgi:hypothetical protein
MLLARLGPAATMLVARAVRSAGGTAAVRPRDAIDHRLRFLEAVGSVLLLNPGSPLPARLERLGATARRALVALGAPPERRSGAVNALQRL